MLIFHFYKWVSRPITWQKGKDERLDIQQQLQFYLILFVAFNCTYRNDTFVFYLELPHLFCFLTLPIYSFPQKKKKKKIHGIINNRKLLHKWVRHFNYNVIDVSHGYNWVLVTSMYVCSFIHPNRTQDLKVLNDILSFLIVFSWNSINFWHVWLLAFLLRWQNSW